LTTLPDTKTTLLSAGGNDFLSAHTEHFQAFLPTLDVLAALSHGLAQGSIVFMVGLAVFAALVWRPELRSEGEPPRGEAGLLRRAIWVLVGLLFLAGAVEIPVYAARASGESLSPGLLSEAVFETRVGHFWMARLGIGILAAYALTEAVRRESRAWWAGGFALCGLLVATLTGLSHASAAGALVPLAADWIHVVAASVWMGGLLGFPLMFVSMLRGLQKEERERILAKAVRRFTRVAAVAVVALVSTGVYASLVHVPSFEALVSTAYGRALIMKLGLVFVMLPIGAINMVDRGGEPFERMVYAELILAFGVFVATGFLSTLPPPG
jgi:copper transport protein